MSKVVGRWVVLGVLGLAAAAAQADPTPYGLRAFAFEAGFGPGLPPPPNAPIQFLDYYNDGNPLTGATKILSGVSSSAAMSLVNAGFSAGVETLPSDWPATTLNIGRLQLRAQDAADVGSNNFTVPGLTFFSNRLTVADVAGSPLLSRTQSFEVRSYWDFTVPDANSYYGLRLSDNRGGGADYNDVLDLRVTLGGDGLTKLQLRRLASTSGLLTHTGLATFDVQTALGLVPIANVAFVGFYFHYNYFGDGSPGNGVRAKIILLDAAGNDLKVFDNVAGGGIGIFNGESFTRPSVGAVWQLAPVPEPATWALMLSGLATVGALARWRRGAAPHLM